MAQISGAHSHGELHNCEMLSKLLRNKDTVAQKLSTFCWHKYAKGVLGEQAETKKCVSARFLSKKEKFEHFCF